MSREERIGSRLKALLRTWKTALLLNEFSWASDRQKEELLPKLLASQNGEIKSIAMAYILENRRVDLLEKHSLAHLPTSLYAMYDSVVPNFESLSVYVSGMLSDWVWLDHGELEKIRNLYDSPEEQEEDTQRFLAQQHAQNLQELKAESEADMQRSQKFANLFRFLCPSFWIPGKQKGGAF